MKTHSKISRYLWSLETEIKTSMHSAWVKRLQKVSFMAALVVTHSETICGFTFNYLFLCFPLSVLFPNFLWSFFFFYRLCFSLLFLFPLSILLLNFVKDLFMRDSEPNKNKPCQCDEKTALPLYFPWCFLNAGKVM